MCFWTRKLNTTAHGEIYVISPHELYIYMYTINYYTPPGWDFYCSPCTVGYRDQPTGHLHIYPGGGYVAGQGRGLFK